MLAKKEVSGISEKGQKQARMRSLKELSQTGGSTGIHGTRIT